MKSLTHFLFALLLSAISSSAFATPQQLMLDLQHMRLASTNAVTNFYMFSGLDADGKYDRRITRSMQRFNDALTSAEQLSPANGIRQEVEAIDAKWQEFSQLMEENRSDMRNRGYPNVRLVDEMGKLNVALVELASKAYVALRQRSNIEPSQLVQKSRDLALLMEEITSQYSARGTSNLGQVFMGYQGRSLENMAEQFQTELEELDAMINTDKARQIMADIAAKWQFMERSVRNYNENTVPFLVVSYNDRIVEHFEELESLIAAN
ncbi:hypothetical protein CHH28_16110 [Bacterioplanes sanyensis]|uniref:NarX-like N-terminal domain-containing protein n=1 Tax=Bacterioplanes sanyensis TaxID=1249553 RepID=A0A222FPE3_9GAMM|nr:hypothetical protein [Bacterioplanes sanyensis]ASP40103.1 hypothetical protein CHH28_16110 [Bacterioplanes sanyensis]